MSRLFILNESPLSRKELFELETKKRCEEFWCKNPPEKLDPSATAIGEERIERTWSLIDKQNIQGKKIADLGCGNGILSFRLFQKGAHVIAVDGAQTALTRISHQYSSRFGQTVFPDVEESSEGRVKLTLPRMAMKADGNTDGQSGRMVGEKCGLNLCKQEGITLKQAFLPYLPLDDQSVEGVILADVIAEIEPPFYRLLMSEISRILTKDGWFVCSTGLDIYSEDALSRFIDLVKSEFEITTKLMSYHRLHFYLWQWMKAPFRWSRAGRESSYRTQQLARRKGFFRLLFYLHSLPGVSFFWRYVTKMVSPSYTRFLKSYKILMRCEKTSKILWGKRGGTHVIVFAKKRRLN